MSSKPSKTSKPQPPRQHECKASDEQFCVFRSAGRAVIGGRERSRWACTNKGCDRVIHN